MMGKGITLNGASARAWIDSKTGVRAKTDEERVERVLTWLEVQLKAGTEGRAGARLIVNSLVTDGLEKTADRLTAGSRTVGVPEPPPTAPVKGAARPALTQARLDALHKAARLGDWGPTGPAIKLARAMAVDGLGEWQPLTRRFLLAAELRQAYMKGKRAGLREGNAGISTPAMSGGAQNPFDGGTVDYAMWALGFQDGAGEKEGG